MDFEISKIDRETCTINRIFFWRFVREALSTNRKGWISKAQLAKFLKLDSVTTLEELIGSKLDILEGLSKYVNGDDILHLIDDLKFSLHIRKGDKWTLFEFLNSSDHSWEEIEVSVWRVVNTGRMFKFTWEDEELYVGADNILRCLGLYDVLFESKNHEILKTLSDKVKYFTNKFTKDYEKLLQKLRMTIIHTIYLVWGSSKLMIEFLNSISFLIGKSDPGFSEMFESYQSIRKIVSEKFAKKEDIKNMILLNQNWRIKTLKKSNKRLKMNQDLIWQTRSTS